MKRCIHFPERCHPGELATKQVGNTDFGHSEGAVRVA